MFLGPRHSDEAIVPAPLGNPSGVSGARYSDETVTHALDQVIQVFLCPDTARKQSSMFVNEAIM